MNDLQSRDVFVTRGRLRGLEGACAPGTTIVNILGRKALLTSGSITAAVDRLESGKRLRRKADPKDGRSRIVEFSPRGADI